MFRSTMVSVALIASVGMTACGTEPDPVQEETQSAAATATAATTTGDVDRYCRLTRELDATGEKFFAQLDRNAGPEEFEAAERRFVQRHESEIQEIQEAAPADIESDVQVLLAAMRQRGGLPTSTEVTEEEATAAESRIQAFEQRNCDS